MSQIRNCKLAFQCEKEWESLTPIPGQRTVRHCTVCRANVFFCKSDEDLAWHVAKDNCVAFFAEPAFLDDPKDLNDEIPHPDGLSVGTVLPEPPPLNSRDTERDKYPSVETLEVDDQVLEKLRRVGLDTLAQLSGLRAVQLELVYDFNDREIEAISQALALKGYSLRRI
jgi:hypothetical protein